LSKGIVHRDVKPANVLIDRRGRSQIADFPSSEVVENPTSLSTDFRSTSCYAAPELYDEVPYMPKIDVFSFALVLYEILVGRSVFSPELGDTRIMFLGMTGVRADFQDSVNSDMKSLISCCWKQDLSDRPSFSAILSDIRKIRFKILPGVDSDLVDQFLSHVTAAVKFGG
jgi:serine/threonine protein kinase